MKILSCLDSLEKLIFKEKFLQEISDDGIFFFWRVNTLMTDKILSPVRGDSVMKKINPSPFVKKSMI